MQINDPENDFSLHIVQTFHCCYCFGGRLPVSTIAKNSSTLEVLLELKSAETTFYEAKKLPKRVLAEI